MATQVINPYKVIMKKIDLSCIYTVQYKGRYFGFYPTEEKAKIRANELFSLLLHENL